MARTAYVSTSTINTAAPTKARKAKTVAAKPAPEAVHAADVSEVDSAEGWLDKIQQSMDGFMKSVHIPSKTRFIVSGLLGLLACASTLYFSMQMIEIIVVAAMLYTGIGFVSFVVTFIGVFIALMGAVTAGSAVFDFCMSFEYSAVKSRVSNFFGRFGAVKKEKANA